MAKISKNVVDADLRSRIFEELDIDDGNFIKINDRQYGIILTDKNGVEELMAQEIATYNEKQATKAAKAAERAKKAEADKARREAKAKEEEA